MVLRDARDSLSPLFESAAHAGNAAAMYNLGALAIRVGDSETASTWWERAAEAGDSDSSATL